MARRIRRLHEEHRLRIRETHGLGLLLGLTFTAHFCAQPYGHLTPWLASRYGERPPRGIRRRRGGDGIWRFAIRTPPAGAVPTSSRHAFRRGRSAAVTHSLTQTHSDTHTHLQSAQEQLYQLQQENEQLRRSMMLLGSSISSEMRSDLTALRKDLFSSQQNWSTRTHGAGTE